MGNALAPKRLTVTQMQNMPTQLLVGHLEIHEQYARLHTNQTQYEKYRCDYLDLIYAEGNKRDTKEWETALAVARIDSIPIKHQLKKGTERVTKVHGGFVYEKQTPTRE